MVIVIKILKIINFRVQKIKEKEEEVVVTVKVPIVLDNKIKVVIPIVFT